MILVTGAAGRLGQRVVKLLLAAGHEVLGTDKRAFGKAQSPFVQTDLCDAHRVADLVSGAEAVIHMGAIPGPYGGGPQEIYRNNGESTFNVMTAAAECGLRRVVFSSSAFAVGWAPDPTAFVPLYLPLDEDHPLMPFEAYGMSKQLGECCAEMIARNSSTSVVSLRFTNVVAPEDQKAFPLPGPTPEDPTTLVMWAYADPAVVAEAHVRALDVETDGHEPFLLAQPETRFAEPTVDLIERNFGDRVPIRGELEGNASVISTAKARRMLGLDFVPDLQRSCRGFRPA